MADSSNINPNALAVAGIAARASKDMRDRLWGPTADYIGGQIKEGIQRIQA